MFDTGILYLENLNATEKIVVNQGGSFSGKTYSILQVLSSKAVSLPKRVITVAGQDIPNLKKGALRDMERIVDESQELRKLIKGYNKSDRLYTFRSGSKMEFSSYADAQDAKSGKRDFLFVNEANGIAYPIYQELELRTTQQSFLDYNPNAEFWVHEHLLTRPRDQVRLIISDHRHNPFCSPEQREKLEGLKETDEELYKVYARGRTGKIEGLIFRNWFLCDEIPKDAKFIGYGLDFGFTNDPTALLGVWMQNGELWVKELLYETNLTNPAICDKLKAFGITRRNEIIADSAEPKSIKEIESGGYWVSPALKGQDSVNSSIDKLKRFKINVTKDSTHLRKELNAYKWRQDKNGKTLNEPVDFMNHLIDALRYVASNLLQMQGNWNYTKSIR